MGLPFPRRASWVCLAAAFLLFLITPAFAAPSAQDAAAGGGLPLPADFFLLAVSGGIAPWESIYRIEIDAAGNGEYRYADETDREADTWTTIDAFTVDPLLLEGLWNTIVAQGYFAFPSTNVDLEKHEGWYAEFDITGNAMTHKVTCQNLSFAGFNVIANALNGVTPVGDDLAYNDILP